MRKYQTHYRLWAVVAILTVAAWTAWDAALSDEIRYSLFQWTKEFRAAARRGQTEIACECVFGAAVPVLFYTIFGVGLGWLVQHSVSHVRPNTPQRVNPLRVDYDDKPLPPAN